jgi:hypothetical protein
MQDRRIRIREERIRVWMGANVSLHIRALMAVR